MDMDMVNLTAYSSSHRLRNPAALRGAELPADRPKRGWPMKRQAGWPL